MIGIPIKKHLKLRYQEEGGRAELVLTDEKMKGYVLKEQDKYWWYFFFLFYFPFGINDGDPVYAMLGEGSFSGSTIVYSMN